ncbi:MAG TPA: hypothetical protein VMW75_03010 [Thermoanaerobaculia bacterium]|nr:hypothetical protein [Thermoanaerobaculia bacterium]
MRKALTAFFLAAAIVPALAAQTGPAAGVGTEGSTGSATQLVATGSKLDAFAPSTGLIYHNGPVLLTARAVFIFWGPTFANPASPDYAYAQALIAFRNQLGTSHPYDIITQYYQIVGGVKQYIELTNLGGGTPDWFDASTPPTDVTDAKVQGEVSKYLASHAFDVDSIYQVFIPSTSYSSDGGITSCGGPDVGYCSYHSYFTSGTDNVVYSIQPYPSCSACQVAGMTTTQIQERFMCGETRESVTDPLTTGWWSAAGGECDALCGWQFTTSTPCGKTWSNAAGKCVS